MFMKNIYTVVSTFILISLFTMSCNPFPAVSYQVIANEKEKTLKGVINKQIIQADTSFTWFKTNYKYAQVDKSAVQVFKQKSGLFSLLVFGGTWCHDTQNLLPIFYKLIDESHYPEKKICLLGVDRQKESIEGYKQKYNITNVPTFIVLHKGKEVGRVVEYGSMGAIDKELAQIVQSIKN